MKRRHFRDEGESAHLYNYCRELGYKLLNGSQGLQWVLTVQNMLLPWTFLIRWPSFISMWRNAFNGQSDVMLALTLLNAQLTTCQKSIIPICSMWLLHEEGPLWNTSTLLLFSLLSADRDNSRDREIWQIRPLLSFEQIFW